MVEVMPEDRIARLMTIRDLVSAGQQAPAGPALPDNTLRNNDTGATYSFQSQAPGASYQADYANPIRDCRSWPRVSHQRRSSGSDHQRPARGFWRRMVQQAGSGRQKTSV